MSSAAGQKNLPADVSFSADYKSILCEEDPCPLELVRYIHLNPLRARLVGDYEELCKYPYGGQSVILGHGRREWQDTDYSTSGEGPG